MEHGRPARGEVHWLLHPEARLGWRREALSAATRARRTAPGPQRLTKFGKIDFKFLIVKTKNVFHFLCF